MAKLKDREFPQLEVEIVASEVGPGAFVRVRVLEKGLLRAYRLFSRKKFLKAVAKELNVAIYEVGATTAVPHATDMYLGTAVQFEVEQSDVGYHAA